MGDEVIVVHQFLDGAGQQIPESQTGETFNVTKTEAIFLDREDGTQSWVLIHYLA